MFVKKLKQVTKVIDDTVAANRAPVFPLYLKVDMSARYNAIPAKDYR
jgi:hypothetical protein